MAYCASHLERWFMLPGVRNAEGGVLAPRVLSVEECAVRLMVRAACFLASFPLPFHGLQVLSFSPERPNIDDRG